MQSCGRGRTGGRDWRRRLLWVLVLRAAQGRVGRVGGGDESGRKVARPASESLEASLAEAGGRWGVGRSGSPEGGGGGRGSMEEGDAGPRGAQKSPVSSAVRQGWAALPGRYNEGPRDGVW